MASQLTACITTTFIKKDRRIMVIDDSPLRGTENPVCQADPPHRDICCLSEAQVRDITRKLISLILTSAY